MNQPQTSSQMPDSLGISLSKSWDYIPIIDAVFEQYVADVLKDAQSREFPKSAMRNLELLLRKMRAELAEGRVAVAGSLVAALEPGADAPGSPEATDLLVASCIVATHRRDELAAPVPLRIEYLLEAMVDPRTKDEESPRTVVDVQPPASVSLTAGPAIELIRLTTEVDPRTTLATDFFSQTYLVPVADGEGLVTVNFLVPNSAHARMLTQLFRHIADTLVVYYPADPTIVPVSES